MQDFCQKLKQKALVSCRRKSCFGAKICHKFCLVIGCFVAPCGGQAFAAPHIPIDWTGEAQDSALEHVHVKGERNKRDVPLEQSGVKANYLNKKADLGPLGTVDLAKAPYSVMQTSHDVIENQQLRTMSEATEYMPSVQLVALSDPALTRFVNRGYESDTIQNSRVDGMNVYLATPYTSEEFDHLDMLNGAAGAIYGPENPAGVLNMIQKRPTAKPFFDFNFGYDSNGAPLESFDTSVGKGPVKIRFNYLNQTGQSYVSTSNMWRNLYSGNIDIQLTKHTKLELDGSQYNIGMYGLPGYFTYKNNVSLPSAPNLSDPGYGQAQGGDNISTSLGQMKLFHQLSNNWSLKLGGSFESSNRNVYSTANNILASAACSKAGISGPCYQQNIAVPSTGRAFAIWSNMAYLNGQFRTGPITHHVNIGSTGYSVSNQSPTFAQTISNVDTVPFYDPQVVAGPQPKIGGYQLKNFTQQQSFLFGDSMDIGRYVSVGGQFSVGWINVKNYTKGRLSSDTKTSGAFSPNVTLDIHPTEHFNAYFNWGTAVQAGPEASAGATNAGDVLPAILSQQFEGGIKYTWRKMQINLDGFGMKRPYAYDRPNPVGPPTTGLFGSQNDSGVEFQVSGAVNRDLSVLGGVTWLDPLVTGTGDPKTNNKMAEGVPPWATDFLLDWHPHYLHGIAFNSNVHYNSKRAANVENTAWAAEYVTLDLGVRYNTKLCDHQLVFRGGVNNVTDENYWLSVFSKSSAGSGNSPNTAAAGAPRTWHITASIYF